MYDSVCGIRGFSWSLQQVSSLCAPGSAPQTAGSSCWPCGFLLHTALWCWLSWRSHTKQQGATHMMLMRIKRDKLEPPSGSYFTFQSRRQSRAIRRTPARTDTTMIHTGALPSCCCSSGDIQTLICRGTMALNETVESTNRTLELWYLCGLRRHGDSWLHGLQPQRSPANYLDFSHITVVLKYNKWTH